MNTTHNATQVTYVPAFDDNYIWFIHGLPEMQAENRIIIVDPGDEEPVLEAIKAHNYQPQAIFITHHHGDHTGGIKELVNKYQIPVYGPARESIPEITCPLSEPEPITIKSMGLEFKILDVPGHTKGHIAYYNEQQLFIGDTLFAGGCGRLFEGTAEQMHHSLSKLLKLSDDTLVYCAHEYTQANLNFARHVEPENPELRKRIDNTQQLREQLLPTVPSLLKLEKQTNPFLRFDINTVKSAAEKFSGHSLDNPAEVFKTVRYWKDTLD
jgi:hydroxyacylglutathione hydrolase